MKHGEDHIGVGEGKGRFSLYYQRWQPDTDCKAAILLIHGYAEHGGRYQGFAEHCTARGYSVYAPDHWGHGKSEGRPGFVNRFSDFTDGVHALAALVRSEQADRPLFLVGHSMGGLISTKYLIGHQDQFAGAVLSGPAIMLAEKPPAVQLFIIRLLSRLLPKLGVMSLDSNGVSRDSEVVEKYLSDPLVYNGKISARLLHELITNMDDVREKASRIKLPMLLLHGEADSLTASAGSQFLHENIASADKMLKIYPGLYHEIFNEPEKDQILGEMTNWLDAHLPPGAT